MKKDFEVFTKALSEAAERMTDPHYFKLHIAGMEDPRFRERVYCYELYHQLRCVLGDSFKYKLDGEVDKKLHPYIEGDKIPDLIVHVPGTMERNLAVIEVKSVEGAQRNNRQELKSDLEKLHYFLDKGQYHMAIMLIYGDGQQDLPDSVLSEVKAFSKKCLNHIVLAWHKGSETRLKII